MARTFSLSVRYASREELAASYDLVNGILSLPVRAAPPVGSRALVDASVDGEAYLLWGEILPPSAGGRASASLKLHVDSRARVEEALEPPARATAVEEPVRFEDRLAVDVPTLVSGKLVARVRDLSAGGARLSFARTAAPACGSLVHLTLFPKGAAAIPAPVIAKVVWRSADGASAGVSFVPGAARSVELLLRHAAADASVPIAA